MGNRAKKIRNEPRLVKIHTLSNPIASNYSALGLVLIASIVASMASVINSIGIISNATI